MMKTEVFETIQKFNMILPGDTIVAAVSGGADSVALLHLLNSLSENLEFTLNAVHVNHNLRGAESLRDENFVRDLCKRLNVPLKVFSVDINKISADTKTGIEECARDVRYRLFAQAAGETGKIATAHSLSDAAETLIFNMCRGSGIRGICSIPPVRGNIIRPLIEVRRAQIEQYIVDNSLEYVTDSTNLSDDYTRNKIRHNIIPALTELNPNFLQAAGRLINSARQADNFIENQANMLISSDAELDVLQKTDEAVLSRYISIRCKNELRISPETQHINDAVSAIYNGSGVCQLPKNTFLKIENNRVVLTDSVEIKDEPFCIPLNAGTAETPYKRYKLTVVSRAEYEIQQKINKLLFKNTIDYDRISENAVIRSRKDGDSIELAGRACTKTLKKLFCESKIPVNTRGRLSVVSDGDKLLWVEGFGVSQSAAVCDSTEKMLIIEALEGEDYYQQK